MLRNAESAKEAQSFAKEKPKKTCHCEGGTTVAISYGYRNLKKNNKSINNEEPEVLEC